jgi:hypothetical protein
MEPACEFGSSDPSAIEGLELAAIYALRPGGPRHDANVTEAEASAPENFLVLCAAHHAVVDASPAEFTGEVLTEWRADAVARTAAGTVPRCSS